MRTFGRLRWGKFQGGAHWGVDQLAPHVAIAFKRLFPKVNTCKTTHILTDNDETRADLEWFMLRYPLDTRDECRALLAEGAARRALRDATRDEILQLDWSPGDVPAAFEPGKVPYLYQEQAAELTIRNPSLLLCDDVGLGKTISTFTVAARGAPLPMAIVVQPHLVRQWAAKAREFTTYRVHEIKSGTPYSLPAADLYIFSYNVLSGWLEVFAGGMFKSVAYDEIQELRHGMKTGKGNAAMVLSSKAELKLGLTATPVYNYGDEMHTVMSYINPDVLGTREEFLREWCHSGGGHWIVTDPDALGSFLDSTGFRLRRREDDAVVDRSMPQPNILDFELDYDRIALAKEQDMLKHLADTVLTGKFEQAGQAARDLDIKMRHLTGVAKAKPVAAYVNMLLKDRKRVILTGWHRDVYDIWRYALDAHRPVLYSGSESAAGKARNVARFVDGDSRVLMISLRSGAGLDGLQHVCKDVVFGELDWSPQVHYQLLGRVRRPGQTEQVTGHYLHVNGGSDPVLMQMLGMKSDQSRGILDPGEAPKVRYSDASRIKELAKHVLNG
jgi:hypothetical protein